MKIHQCMDGSIDIIDFAITNYIMGGNQGYILPNVSISASIAQWLERRPSIPAVVRSSPGWSGHICACHVEAEYLLANKGYARHQF